MTKAERDTLRQEMLRMGCTPDAIVRELGRRWQVRPRQAYRQAHGWSQDEVARRFVAAVARLETARGPGTPGPGTPGPGTSGPGPGGLVPAPVMSGSRIGENERWPLGGRRPSVYALLVLAEVFQAPVGRLLDYQDHRSLPETDRAVLAAVGEAGSPRPPGGSSGSFTRAG